MANFAFVNFCTIYSSEGKVNKAKRREYCFGTVFYDYNGVQKNTYHITVYKVGDKLIKNNDNNACFTDRKGIIRHLKIVKELLKGHDFHYKVTNTDEGWDIKLTLDADILYHKYLLTWVRYLYEFPFNMFLVEANKLKQLPEFKNESIINLFNLVGATSGISQHGTDIHAIGATEKFKVLLKRAGILKSIEKLIGDDRGKRVNDIFKYADGDFKTVDDPDTLKDSDVWDSEEKFLERLELYKENYKLLKQK